MIITIEKATSLVRAAMQATGHTADEAKTISDHLIDCELRGFSFGGLSRAVSIVERIRATERPRRPMTVVKETAISASLDGGDQVGYLVAAKATDMAISKARSAGLAVAGAKETWYTGMYSYYLEKVTKAGFAGMIGGSAPPRVAPHGGTEGRFGTNPVAFGFPSTGVPVIWDIGTAAVMSGEVMLHQRLGQPLPAGVAFDRDGMPTRDASEALAGAFGVWGGHKGSGLAMSMQLLGMMCGAAAAPPVVSDCGFFLIVIDPELLAPGEDYPARVAHYADDLRATRPLDISNPVRVPFERSAAVRDQRRADGVIEVPDKIAAMLQEVGQIQT